MFYPPPLIIFAAVMSSFVSHLPGAVLDIIISIPYLLLSSHKALSRRTREPTAVKAPPPAPASASVPSIVSVPPEVPASTVKETTDSAQTSGSEHERDTSENGSEADVESNDGAGVSESWVSLGPNSTTTEAAAT
jgi:hypothetical protein